MAHVWCECYKICEIMRRKCYWLSPSWFCWSMFGINIEISLLYEQILLQKSHKFGWTAFFDFSDMQTHMAQHSSNWHSIGSNWTNGSKWSLLYKLQQPFIIHNWFGICRQECILVYILIFCKSCISSTFSLALHHFFSTSSPVFVLTHL